MIDLRGKSALLLGAKRIGGYVARRLASEGVNLAIGYRNSKAEAERLASEIYVSVERTAVVVQADLSIEPEVERLVDETASELGGLSFVINMASDYHATPFTELDGADWDRSMDTARSSFLLMKSAAHIMMANPGPTRGHIVLFSDWAAGETPYTGYIPYLTAKAAISFMVRAFAVELAPHGILVNGIAPGPTMRPPEITPSEWERDAVALAPLKRESSPDDIAEMIVAMLKSETITGETVRVDSGRHLAGPGVKRPE